MAGKKLFDGWSSQIGLFVGSMACFACIAIVSIPGLSIAQEYTPDHDVVKKMIADGMKFLSSENSGRTREGPGYDVLIGFTALKATDDHDNRLVNKATVAAIKIAKNVRDHKSLEGHAQEILYEAAIAAMFFAALDPIKHRADIESIRDFLVAIQRKNGSYGYLVLEDSGDVSQSQYAALAFWSIKQVNINVDPNVVEKLTIWIATAQRPDGCWTYQFPPRSQDQPKHQMLAAGLSAILVCADTIGVLRGTGGRMLDVVEEEEDDGVPKAFRRIIKEAKKNPTTFVPKTVTRTGIVKISKSAEGWFAKNKYKRSDDWFYYLVYSQERYESFLEILNGKRSISPSWYNEMVKTLIKNQAQNGGWGVGSDQDTGGSEVATCFSILFLLRSTQKAIGDIKTADSVGGYGLGNVADVGFVDGKLVDKSQVSSIEDAIKLLEDSKDGSTEDKLLADRMALDPDPKKKREQLDRFARLLRSPDARARRVAAKLLGRGDDLDFAPDLIFALSEGEQDGQVLRIAENSLRILSRQLSTYILPREGLVTPGDRVKSERHWQNWYLNIRPDYIFVD